MLRDISGRKPVQFDDLLLDPNNPRLGREDKDKLGYKDPGAIADPKVQRELELVIKKEYGKGDNSKKFDELMQLILDQGWLPVDPIIVWEHPKKKGKYIVVEGNTRTAALREIRK